MISALNKQGRRWIRHASSSSRIGLVGLGAMGSKMALNLLQDKNSVVVYDRDPQAIATTLQQLSKEKIVGCAASGAKSIAELVIDPAAPCSVVFSMLPNDDILEAVSNEMLQYKPHNVSQPVHISCSTISPALARKLQVAHQAAGWDFISAPVFARPDGIFRRQAVFMISGEPRGRDIARMLLQSMGRVEDFGDEVSAANVTKLCGNYLIAASIEAMSEAMVFAEKHDVDREKVMNLLNTTIFDCLIYKGYGQRVSQRDHRPGGFALELGLKDVLLVQGAARRQSVPMPFLSVLADRFVAAKAQGRGALDWSAITLGAAADAGLDVNADLKRNVDILEEQQKRNKSS